MSRSGVAVDVDLNGGESNMPSQAVDVHTESETDIDIEGLARLIVREVRDYSGGLPGRWVPLITIVQRLALLDQGATTDAVQFAVDQRWLDEFGGHSSVRLTGVGRGIR
jgi:hypothetical protein